MLKLEFIPLSAEKIRSVYSFCEENVEYISLSFKDFMNRTINSNHFKPDLSIVALNEDRSIIGFFMLVLRRSVIFPKKRKVAVLKFCVVHENWRTRGIGTKILEELIYRLRRSSQKNWFMKFEVFTSMPDYLYPGLDPRLTEAFFFLRKNGFRKGRERINLSVDLGDKFDTKPDNKIQNYIIERASKGDLKQLVEMSFMPLNYRLGFWSEEIELSFKNDPISTFVAKKKGENEIFGWTSHSVQFQGSFGPTGVKKSERGKGVGKKLLEMCLWDIKRQNKSIESVTIIWVGIDTIYYYLKSIEAHISQIFWEMKKRI